MTAESLFRKIARKLTSMGIAIVPTYPGLRHPSFDGWGINATTDMAKVDEWLTVGYPLPNGDGNTKPHLVTEDHNWICIAKHGGVGGLDIDDYDACVAMGMPPIPADMFQVDTPSGGLHVPFIHTPETEALGKVRNVVVGGKAVCEFKGHNQGWCAPWQARKDGGVYQPRDNKAPIWTPTAEMVGWIDANSKPAATPSKDEALLDEDFDFAAFCDHYDIDTYGSEPWFKTKVCPYAGYAHEHSKDTAIYYDGDHLGFKCFAAGCGDPSIGDLIRKLNETHDRYPGVIWREESIGETLEAFGVDVGENMEETVVAKASSSFLNDDEQEVIEAKETGTVTTFALTDLGNGERFQWRYGHEFAWTKATGWLHYKDGCWHRDSGKEAERAMHDVVRKITEEAELYDSKEMQDAVIGWAKKSESHSKIEAGLACASALLAKDYGDFDQMPHQLNCANGTLDMETGEFRKHDPADLLTKSTGIAYDPAAKCPKFEVFVSQVMGGNAAKINYLKRAGGYTLSDETGEQDVFIPHGMGGTGKTTFLTVLQGIMGDYAKTADPEMFMLKRGDSGQPFDLAGLEGTRALLAVETEENKHLAVAKVKRMTGGDVIRACYKHRDWYEFTPVWKIWLATNEFPHTPASDDAAWDRLKPVPFTVRFRDTAEEVKDLAKKLVAEEGSGILNWFLDGYRDWKANGLKEPDEVKIAAEQLREVEDWLGRFLEEHVEKTANQWEFVSNERMFQRVDKWAWDTKEVKNLNTKKFAAEMKKRGHESKPVREGGKIVRVWIGLKLKDVAYQPSQPPSFNPPPFKPEEVV